MTVVVLASASPARLGVLRSAGVDPVVRVSGVDEDAVLAALADQPAAERVAALAAAKADAVVDALLREADDVTADAVVIGCDSMLLLDGRLQGKPASAADARERWAAMAGRDGDLLTGHAVRRLVGGAVAGSAQATGRTVVRMGTPSTEELSTYVATGEPLAVAGALTIDGFGGWFVEGIDGDPSNVIGLSLPLTRRLLGAVGLAVHRLWRV